MTDLLRMEYINSLPHPFLARFSGEKDWWWPVNDFEVQTGLLRIDVCGKLEVKSFCEVMEIRDGDHVTHDPDTFYSDWGRRGPDTEYTYPVDQEAQFAVEETPGALPFARSNQVRPRRK
jgi:hypothetical protein